MWWISLIVLAVVALFLVKYIQSQVKNRQTEQTNAGLQAPAAREGLAGTAANQAEPAMETIGDNTVSRTVASDYSATAVAATGAAVASAGATVAGAVSAGTSIDVSAVPTEHKAALNSGNTFNDIREMIKILNLAEPDARRLAISPEQLRALRNGDQNAIGSEQELGDLAARLRRMIG